MVDAHFHAIAMRRKFKQNQKRRVKQTLKPKVKSSFEDSGFCNRVLARAEQLERQRIIAGGRGRKSSTPKKSATTRWKRAVETAVEACGDRRRAVAMVDQKHPGLRESMLKEVNAQ